MIPDPTISPATSAAGILMLPWKSGGSSHIRAPRLGERWKFGIEICGQTTENAIKSSGHPQPAIPTLLGRDFSFPCCPAVPHKAALSPFQFQNSSFVLTKFLSALKDRKHCKNTNISLIPSIRRAQKHFGLGIFFFCLGIPAPV